ncbi:MULTISPECIES: hypothetical protein [Vibrio]|uniref:hypothetical protein n=2 Tax=Vibrionaceae TaxID=641 RepID=UPI0018691728|nr:MULTISPECIES: hypothetical protein [Gammaproteobacteria]MCG3861768.1 hypothetical protein [Psychrobacter sp. Ps5]
MNRQTVKSIYQSMSEYYRKGKKSGYKKKQMKRLIRIIQDILQNEGTSQIKTIGKRQIIGYWRRTEHESPQTRREKYNILKKYFEVTNEKIKVPQPREKSIKDIALSATPTPTQTERLFSS